MRAARIFCAIALSLSFLLPPTAAFANDLPATVELEVEKRLEGDAPLVAEEYSFVLEGVEDAPMPDVAKVKIVGEGTTRFPAITYSAPGTFRYVIRELAGDAEGCTYDASMYDVTVEVTTDDAGALSAVVWGTKRGSLGKEGSFLFVNTYEPSTEKGKDPLFGFLPTTGDSAYIAFSILTVIAILVFVVGAVSERAVRRR